MQKNLSVFICAVLLLFSLSPLQAKSKIEEEILESLGFIKEFLTYEDVNDIYIKNDIFSGDILTDIELKEFEKPVSQVKGDKLLKRIKNAGGLIFLKDKDVKKFLDEKFSLDGGKKDKKTKKWDEKKYSGLPFFVPAEDTIEPGYEEFALCLKGGWKYVPPFNYEPDEKSCNVSPWLCDFPPCILNDGSIDSEDADGESDEKYDDLKNKYKDLDVEHFPSLKNVFKELKKVVSEAMKDAEEITKDNSSLFLKIIMRDRTPPRIIGCDGGEFPELGKDSPATTGDWYKISGLRIIDNGSYLVGTCLCLGKIDSYPSLNWTEEEDWVKENPRKLVSGDEAEYVILPNMCQGAMRYSIFAWDEDGLLNPGEPLIEEDQPEICYGLRKPPLGSENLLRDPELAKPWPLKVTYGDQIHKINPDDIKPGSRRGEGFVHITDNDLPNILIRFESVKDGRKIFFPPAVQPGSLPVFSSDDYKKGTGVVDGNEKDYENFIGAAPGTVFTSELVDESKPLYFNILDVKPSPFMDPAEIPMLEKFMDPTQKEFICKHFRLEDFNESDTDLEGNQIVGVEETFGKRNGFGQEVVAVLNTPLQEDVAYRVSVWADDNVKWATMETGKVLEKIIPIPTGIVAGDFSLVIPNQIPAAAHKRRFDPGNAITEEVQAVFREPTISGGGRSIGFYETNKFPFIEVTATDFAGHFRKIKLYIRVSNENPNIRILERQHEKK